MGLRASTGGVVSGSAKTLAVGSGTPTANGILTAFTFAHGLGSAPVYANAIPKNLLSAAFYYTTSDATNITVTYAVAPLAGALSFAWIAAI